MRGVEGRAAGTRVWADGGASNDSGPEPSGGGRGARQPPGAGAGGGDVAPGRADRAGRLCGAPRARGGRLVVSASLLLVVLLGLVTLGRGSSSGGLPGSNQDFGGYRGGVGVGIGRSQSGTHFQQRLQRSRSESALMQLERRLSNSNIADEASKGLPGDKTIVWSDLFHYLARPDMLKGVSPKLTSAPTSGLGDKEGRMPMQPLMNKDKLVVVLVGLPARGKSYISHRLVNYLNWVGVRCRLFNVGAFRRTKLSTQETGGDGASRADFFSKDNVAAANQREELAETVLEELLSWLTSGQGNMAIFDATNSKKDRRARVLRRALKEPGVEVVFVESICTDEKVVEANLAEKVKLSPDFKGMDFNTAVKDLKKRIANYEAVYESVGEDEKDPRGNSISFIKVINLSSKVIANNIHGRVARSVLTFLMNLHIMQRPIFLVRAPHPDGAPSEDGNWQIQGSEPSYPNVLTNVITEGDASGEVAARAREQPENDSVPKVPTMHFCEEKQSVLHILGETSIHVARTGDVRTPCSVHYQTVDGTGKAGKHYTHIQGEIYFAENQTRQELKVPVGDPLNDCVEHEKTFYVVLSGPRPETAKMGARQQCAVTIYNDENGLPDRLRSEWSRLRFPDSGRLGRGLNEGGLKSADRLGRLLATQVKEFYMHQHKNKMARLEIIRDVMKMRLEEAEADVRSTVHRRTVVEEALRLQHRMEGTVTHNYTTTIRLTGHLYNKHLLEQTLDIIEASGASVRSVGEPVLGGTRSCASTIVLQVSGILEEHAMQEVLNKVKALFQRNALIHERDMNDAENSYESAEIEDTSRVEVLEEARDVGEMGKLMRQLQERKDRVERLKEELQLAEEAVTECASMEENDILQNGKRDHPTQVFTSTLPVARQTGERLFRTEGVHEDTSNLNPADIWATYGMTLAEVYDLLGKDARQFLHSPYTARLPGGEALKDVVRRLEPFVVDLLERQRSPVVVVSHLGTLQVLYQYFVGVGSDVPFWKLDIPRGSVIQLVPHLFGFEERRFSFKGGDDQSKEAEGEMGVHAVHMVSHWEG